MISLLFISAYINNSFSIDNGELLGTRTRRCQTLIVILYLFLKELRSMETPQKYNRNICCLILKAAGEPTMLDDFPCYKI